MTPNNSIIRIALAASLAGHCLLLRVPGIRLPVASEKEPEAVHMTIELEEPFLLPEVDKIGDEQKLEERTTPLKKERLKQDAESGEVSVKDPVREQPEETVEAEDPARESMLRYRDMVKKRIEKVRRYPAWAEKRGIQGITEIGFVILSDGVARNVRVVCSSGSDILDREAARTIKRAGLFPPVPKEAEVSSVSMRVSILFSG